MKVSELDGALLDMWVARAELDEFKDRKLDSDVAAQIKAKLRAISLPFRPSLNWAQGGPIIERERLVVWPYRILDWESQANGVQQDFAAKRIGMPDPEGVGPSYLIAAMRAYIASKFGDSVPDEMPA